MSFKLLAITPLRGCSVDFCKNLVPGEPNKFYTNYQIEFSGSLVSLAQKTHKSKVPDKLYKLNNGIQLHVSGVVGKNGTGKSTLFELLYYLIYIVSSQKKINGEVMIYRKSDEILSEIAKMEDDRHRLENIYNIHRKMKSQDPLSKFEEDILKDDYSDPSVLLSKLNTDYRFNVPNYIDDETELYNWTIREIDNKIERARIMSELEKLYEKKIEDDLKVSILFEREGIVYELGYWDNSIHYSYFRNREKVSITNEIEKLDLESLFYNISVNFSHHALNSKSLGNWITGLFHKNDAYTTPVVINPMRTSGNFDINREIYLLRERLLGNYLYDKIQGRDYSILGGYKISKFIFTMKFRFPHALSYGPGSLDTIKSGPLIKEYLGIESIENYIDFWDYAIGYLERKIMKTRDQYGFLIKEDDLFQDKVTEFVKNDQSHITKKIRQTLNFLKATYRDTDVFWKLNEQLKIELTEEELMEWLDKFGLNLIDLNPSEIIEYALPGFFNIDFEFANSESEGIKPEKLSSGEQQIILNINSILYHLYNLQSVHFSDEFSSKNGLDRIRYKNINIVLDEIELYYHPEMQQKLVNDLVVSFEKICNDNSGIESINVCILTHSPFILSDIPQENLLKLGSDGQFGEQNTFGANIHHLLANEFFLSSGYIGDFAKGKIAEIIQFTKREEEEITEEEFTYYKCLIELIGEPVIKNKLNRTMEDKFPLFSLEGETMFERINRQEAILKKLKNHFNRDSNETN